MKFGFFASILKWSSSIFLKFFKHAYADPVGVCNPTVVSFAND